MTWDDTTPPLVHIYAQEEWHDDAYIVANRAGLQALRNALDTALSGDVGRADLYTGDGEGYEAFVLLVDEDEAGHGTWDVLALPYTEDYARESSEHALWPSQILQERGAQ